MIACATSQQQRIVSQLQMSGSPSATQASADNGAANSAADLRLGSRGPSSLVAACYDSLTTAPLDQGQLEQLPQHLLVQLLTQAAADRDQARAVAQAQQQDLARLVREEEQQYVVNPPNHTPPMDRDRRDSTYERVRSATAKWTPRRKQSDFTAHHNVSYHNELIKYDTLGKTIVLRPRDDSRTTTKRLSLIMSSALLSYRLCCFFEGLHVYVEGWDGYHNVWTAEVQHLATGKAVGFSEIKGAGIILLSDFHLLEGPRPAHATQLKQFEDDMLDLLNLLYDDKCPHSYDGIVAGTVA